MYPQAVCRTHLSRKENQLAKRLFRRFRIDERRIKKKNGKRLTIWKKRTALDENQLI